MTSATDRAQLLEQAERAWGREVAQRYRVLLETGMGPEPDALLAELHASGLRLSLGNQGELRVEGAPNRAQRKLIAVRQFDLVAWLAGDRTRGVRRLGPGGPNAWVPRAPGSRRQAIAEL